MFDQCGGFGQISLFAGPENDYLYADGEWHRESIVIKGALRNDGTEYTGTIENAYFNGSLYTNWLPLVHSAWNF